MLTFDLRTLHGKDDALGDAKQIASVSNTMDNFPHSFIPDKLRFGAKGEPFFRTSAPFVCFAAVAATGLLAALVSLQTTDKDAAFVCALSAAANFVACLHYVAISKIRAQNFPHSYMHLQTGRGPDGAWVGKTDDNGDDIEDAKLFAQELYVDAFRYGEWAATFWILVISLNHLSTHATNGAEAWIDKFVAAALALLMVFFASVYRFYANELRSRAGAFVYCIQLTIGVASFLAFCAILGVLIEAITRPTMEHKCGPNQTPGPYGKCTIEDSKLKNDALAVQTFAFSWIGYPVVIFVSRFIMRDSGFAPTPWISYSKDFAFATLDVFCKAGLALFVAFRAM